MTGIRTEVGHTGIAVVIVAFNNADTIAQLVETALGLPECELVVVVDNGSDGSADIAQAAGAKVLRRPDNPGFGSSQNAGVALVDQPFVLLLNPDAEPNPAGVAAGIQILRTGASVAAVQGVITSRHHGGPERSMGPDIRWVHLVGRALALRNLLRTRVGRSLALTGGVADHVERVPENATAVETLSAVAPLFRTSAFREVKGFDESYFLYGEDLDLCRRLRIRGWELVGIPVSWATHADGSTAKSDIDRELSWWTGTMRYAAGSFSTLAFYAALCASGVMACRILVRRPSLYRTATRSMLSVPFRLRLTARETPPNN